MTTRESTLKSLTAGHADYLIGLSIPALTALYAQTFDETPPEAYSPTRMVNALLRAYGERLELMPTATLTEYLSPSTFDEANETRDR
jgi:hypothetical protein